MNTEPDLSATLALTRSAAEQLLAREAHLPSPPLVPLQPIALLHFAPVVYLVLVNYGHGIGYAITETMPERCNWDHVINCIAKGEWDDVRQVVKLEAGGTWRDVTDLARAAVRVMCAAKGYGSHSFCE